MCVCVCADNSAHTCAHTHSTHTTHTHTHYRGGAPAARTHTCGRLQRKVDHNRAATTAAFAQTRHFRDERSAPPSSAPGPGSYTPGAAALVAAAEHAGAGAVFRSGTARLASRPALDGPAPGAYDTLPPGVPVNRARHAMSAPFRSGVSRLAPLAPADVLAAPGPGAYEGARAHAARGVAQRDDEDESLALSLLPLPLTCVPLLAAMPTTVVFFFLLLDCLPYFFLFRDPLPPAGLIHLSNPNDGRPLSMFANEGLDRFGRPVMRRTVAEEAPGPGSYSVGAELGAGGGGGGGPKKGRPGTSVFKSTAKRGETGGAALPGPGACVVARAAAVMWTLLAAAMQWRDGLAPPPRRAAFYKPEPLGKKSFLLNAGRRFL
jgi:hypothetical protein